MLHTTLPRLDCTVLYMNIRVFSQKCAMECTQESFVGAQKIRSRTLLCSLRFGQHGSPLSHLNNNLLDLHMMNTTMNRQQRKTVQADMSSMMLRNQLNNLILRPNLKSEITCHSQDDSYSHLTPFNLALKH